MSSGELPVAVTFCPLCNSAIVFDRRVDGKALRFGVSGNLRFSDLVMWDNATETWWQQLTGEAIVGEYVGRKLDMVSSQLISFGLSASAIRREKCCVDRSGYMETTRIADTTAARRHSCTLGSSMIGCRRWLGCLRRKSTGRRSPIRSTCCGGAWSSMTAS